MRSYVFFAGLLSSVLTANEVRGSLVTTNEEAVQPDSVNVRFDKEAQTVARQREGDLILQYTVKASGLVKGKEYKVSVKVDPKSTLAGPGFALEVPFTTFVGEDDEMKKNIFLTIKEDSLSDRQRTVILKVSIADKDDKAVPNKGTPTTLTVKVDEAGPAINDYNYLAYVGTNFDLVDGIQANNLFFAANVFVPRSTDSRKGIFLSLYGNRSFSSIDSASNVPFRTKLSPTSDSTYSAYYSLANMKTTITSDNLGAYFSPFFGMGHLSDKDNGVQYHFTPSAEFVWRRISRKVNYSDLTPSDTVDFTGSIPVSLVTPEERVLKQDRFEFKIGPGLFISHDTPKISVHCYFNAGYSALFLPFGAPDGMSSQYKYDTQHDFYVSGRAWITEPHTGLTLQAEVTNTWKDPRPFYVVTLSKAFSFKNLGSIFQPITSR